MHVVIFGSVWLIGSSGLYCVGSGGYLSKLQGDLMDGLLELLFVLLRTHLMGCSLYLNHSFFGPLKFLFVVLDFACLVNVFVGSISFVQCVPIFVACVSCFEIYWIIFTSLASFAGYIMFVDTTELLTVCFHAVDSNAVLLLHGAGGTCKNVSESANPLYPADNGGHRGPFLHRCDGLASCCERIEFRLLGSRARLFPCQGAFLR